MATERARDDQGGAAVEPGGAEAEPGGAGAEPGGAGVEPGGAGAEPGDGGQRPARVRGRRWASPAAGAGAPGVAGATESGFGDGRAGPGSLGRAHPRERGWWRRVGTSETGFRYLKVDGTPLTWEPGLKRVTSLVIPPAWRDVHVAPAADWKVQAWGIDQAGRKQYIYSAEHVAHRDRRKWSRVPEVGRILPQLREVTNSHLKCETLCREKVLATVVRLIARAYFRAGSERYAVANRTFGICTLTKRHVRIEGQSLVFSYVGKRSKDQRQVVADTPLVEIIGELMALPGDRLFQHYNVAGVLQEITAKHVNQYLTEVLGVRYTSKDLRTFGGTVRAATILSDLGPPRSDTEARKNVVLTCKLVSLDLGNTPAICRAAYIHPAVLEEYQSAGRTIEPLMRRAPRAVEAEEPVSYYPEEAALIRFLERYG